MWWEWSECSALNVAYNIQKSPFIKCVHVDFGKHGNFFMKNQLKWQWKVNIVHKIPPSTKLSILFQPLPGFNIKKQNGNEQPKTIVTVKVVGTWGLERANNALAWTYGFGDEGCTQFEGDIGFERHRIS